MQIRSFKPSDADALRAVFYSSVHGLARNFYTPEQLAAWAPATYDRSSWMQRLSANKPFIALAGDSIAGFADLQDGGYIDQFFVAPAFARRGVGSLLMDHIVQSARGRSMSALHSNVSLAAEALFARHGFRVTERRIVRLGDVELKNSRMERSLSSR